MAYYRLEPFGFYADNLHSALIASAITKSNMKNFMFEPKLEEESKKQTADEMKAILLGYVTVKKKKEDKDG